ncbi:MAG: ATP-binding protein [Thermoplasmata archaeon]
MLKSELKEIVKEQNEAATTDTNIIDREILDKIGTDIKSQFIIIISGLRRSGKSTLLTRMRKDTAGYYLNFDDDRLIKFTVEDFQTLYEAFLELYGEKNTFYFDEIQNIKGWERFVRRLHDNGMKVFITGSNASMLSRELGTHLTGRHISYHLYPFSFREYLKFKKIRLPEKNAFTTTEKATFKGAFEDYIKNGGLPEYLKTENREYLKTLYDNILYRDVLIRYHLSNEKALKELLYYVAGNVSKETSFNSIKKILGLGSSTTVREYFNYLENSFLLSLVSRFDYSIKKQIYSNKKVYLIDTALAINLGYRVSKDMGRLLENAVFIELKRRNFDVYYHRDKHECDFLCMEQSRAVQAIQVCYEFNEETRERETNGIIEAMEKHKLKTGLVLTSDQQEELVFGKKKIVVKPIWKWMLEGN